MSWSYWQGRRGEAYMGGDVGEYNRGLRDGGHGGGGGLAMVVVLLFIIYIIIVALVIALWAATASLLAALLIVLAMRVWDRSRTMPFGFAFRTAFYSTLTLMGVSTALGAIMVLLLKNGIGVGLLESLALHMRSALDSTFELMRQQPQRISSFFMLSALVDYAVANPIFLFGYIAVFWGPAFLVCGAIFSRRIGAPFNGLRGYLKAVLTAALCITPSLLLTNYMVLKLATRARIALPDTEVLSVAAVVASLSVVGYVLLGGLVMAMVMYIGMRIRYKKEAPSLGRMYGTAVLGGLVYALTTALALFAFPQGDNLLGWMYARALDPHPFASAAADLDTLAPALWRFLPLQLPGLLLFGGIMASRLKDQFPGYLGYVRASVLSGALALCVLLPFMALGTMGVADKAQREARTEATWP